MNVMLLSQLVIHLLLAYYVIQIPQQVGEKEKKKMSVWDSLTLFLIHILHLVIHSPLTHYAIHITQELGIERNILCLRSTYLMLIHILQLVIHSPLACYAIHITQELGI